MTKRSTVQKTCFFKSGEQTGKRSVEHQFCHAHEGKLGTSGVLRVPASSSSGKVPSGQGSWQVERLMSQKGSIKSVGHREWFRTIRMVLRPFYLCLVKWYHFTRNDFTA